MTLCSTRIGRNPRYLRIRLIVWSMVIFTHLNNACDLLPVRSISPVKIVHISLDLCILSNHLAEMITCLFRVDITCPHGGKSWMKMYRFMLCVGRRNFLHWLSDRRLSFDGFWLWSLKLLMAWRWWVILMVIFGDACYRDWVFYLVGILDTGWWYPVLAVIFPKVTNSHLQRHMATLVVTFQSTPNRRWPHLWCLHFSFCLSVREYGHAVFAPVASADSGSEPGSDSGSGSGSGASLFELDRIRSMCAVEERQFRTHLFPAFCQVSGLKGDTDTAVAVILWMCVFSGVLRKQAVRGMFEGRNMRLNCIYTQWYCCIDISNNL